MSTASSSGQQPPRRPSKRSRLDSPAIDDADIFLVAVLQKLRNGTFIIPSTGERSRRNFSLRTPSAATPDGSPDGRLGDDVFWPVLDEDLCTAERLAAAAHNCKATLVRMWRWLNSDEGHGLLKCTLAYVLGSLFTFWPPLMQLLGSREGKHITATITVYFHPARTIGSMLEAVVISIIAVAYAETICMLSMGIGFAVGGKLGLLWLSHIMVLVFFIGGGLGFVGWVKQRLNQPLVNVACTLASIAIISIVTKENVVQRAVFDDTKIVQVLKMLLFGISITFAVNVLLWPKSARHILRDGMTTASTTLGDMLSMITRGFLTGSEDELLGDGFAKCSDDWTEVYARMNKTLREAKFEHYFLGHEHVYQLDKQVFKSLEGLAQSIGGLRSSAYTQFTLMKETGAEPQASGTLSPGSTVFSPTLTRSLSWMLKRGNSNGLSVIDESPLEEGDGNVGPLDRVVAYPPPGHLDISSRTFRTPSDIFELFIALLGPSMKSIAFTLSEILKEPPFGGSPNYNNITVNDHFRQSLTDAVNLYNGARTTGLMELYKSIELDRSRSEKIQADFEEVAAACGHFSFSLQALGEEMHRYLDALDELKLAVEDEKRSWHWLHFWIKLPCLRFWKASPVSDEEDREREPLIRPIRKSAVPKGIPDAMISRRDSFAWDAAPQSSKVVRTMSQRALKSLRILARDDIRFGLKVGFGAALWALLAFLPHTQPIYMHWRGEWGLLSFMIVCSMTVGASNTTGYARFLGTIMGATCAIINWNISSGDPIPLFFLGWLVSVAAFYVILVVGNAPMGRITLLAYNVSTLYAYSMSLKILPDDQDDEDDGAPPLIFEIVKHRVLAVMAGILWGLIICRVVWPISARKKFKEGLSVFYLQMGLIWKRGPLAVLLHGSRPYTYLKTGEQAALQRYSSRLESLRKSASAEFSLRGPFPGDSMGRVMKSTRRILDAFHAMSLVEQRRLLYKPGGHHLSEGERVLLALTSQERRVLCDRICHVFQVLASSLMMEYPLTDAIPSIQGSRDRLLGRIYAIRKEVAAMGERQKEKERETQETERKRERRGSGGSLTGVGVGGITKGASAGDLAASSTASAAAAAAAAGPITVVTGTAKPVNGGTQSVSTNGSYFTSAAAKSTSSSTTSLIGLLLPPGTVVEERDYALLYAYALITNQVGQELKEVEREIERLYGVLDERDMLLQ
ncbi:hypothetical protein MKZ38_010209 [Zalerion maritima]|uniref:Integral membrane bound transporter domain-containing protein n=1 Tax=Zalerion maritima TaxID=339359 RepID=A0AAD5S0X1_9PEZI|nr:hypothetical protein MKZ38_010209 [Zalerion maritima]